MVLGTIINLARFEEGHARLLADSSLTNRILNLSGKSCYLSRGIKLLEFAMSTTARRLKGSCVVGVTVEHGVAELHVVSKKNSIALQGYFIREIGLEIAANRSPAVMAFPADSLDEDTKEMLLDHGHLLMEIAPEGEAGYLNARICADLALKKLNRAANGGRIASSNSKSFASTGASATLLR
jgi:hypothetical protein